MSLFNLFDRTNGNNAQANNPNSASQPSQPSHPKKPRHRTGRTAVYSVRVSTGFKAEILALMSELQREQGTQPGKPRHITEGEVIELLLAHFKAARSATAQQLPARQDLLSDEVWEGICAIAQAEQNSPQQAIEQLVVRKIAELGLMPIKA